MNSPANLPKQSVTVGDIAELAGVRPSAVSNWRKRYTDFPSPVDSLASADVFNLTEVLAWMQQHGRSFQTPAPSIERALWTIREVLRGVASPEESALLTLQFVYLRQQASATPTPTASPLARFWASSDGSTAIRRWESAVAQVASNDAGLRRALALPSGIDDVHLWRVMELLTAAQGEGIQWGPIATALLRRYEDAAGMRGSFFATPRSVTGLAVAMLEPIHGVVYDPACGLGMVLAEMWKLRSVDGTTLVGQEVNERSWRLGYLHLSINRASFQLANGDTLRSDQFRDVRADRVFVDPPLGGKMDVSDLFGDERWSYGVPRASTDWLWTQQALFHLGNAGVGVAVMPPMALSRGGQDATVRRAIVESDALDVVIELPPGLWSASGAAAAMLVLAKRRSGREGRVLFIDGRQLGTARRGKNRELSSTDVQRIMDVIDAWRSGNLQPESMFAATADFDAISRNDGDLAPSRYVGYEAGRVTTIENEAIGPRLERLRERVNAALSAPEDTIAAAAAMVRNGANSLAPSESASWPIVRLAEILTAAPCTGMRQEEEKEGPAIPYIQSRLVSSGVGHIDALPVTVTRGQTRGRLATRGDLLLTSRGIEPGGPVGCATVRFDGEAAFSASLMRLRVDDARVEPDYLRLYLTSRLGRATLVAVTTGNVIANLRGSALAEVRIPLPPLAAQRAIISAMAQVEDGIARFSAVMKDANELFDTMREAVADGSYAPPVEERQ